jgi:hypothetical protein
MINYIFKFFFSLISIFNKKLALKLRGLIELKYWLNLKIPSTYNEKINVRKLYNKNYLIPICANKFELKGYIDSLKINAHTTKTFWTGTILSLNIFESLPNQFVIKISNDNGSRSWHFVKDKNSENLNKLVDKFNKRVKYRYGRYSGEKWYDETKNVILIEEFLDGNLYPLEEVKIYCFNSLINKTSTFDFIIRLIKDRTTIKSQSFYDKDWNQLKIKYMGNINHECQQKPSYYDELVELSRIISLPFDHVRIDYIIFKNKLYVNELTFADSSGFVKFGTKSNDLHFGSLWNLKNY